MEKIVNPHIEAINITGKNCNLSEIQQVSPLRAYEDDRLLI
jgi:hypothetical protein